MVTPDRISRAVWDANSVSVAYTGTAARNSTDLVGGVYYVIATTDCFFIQGDSSITATTSANYLPAKMPVVVEVTGSANARISFIQLSANGTAYIMNPKGSP